MSDVDLEALKKRWQMHIRLSTGEGGGLALSTSLSTMRMSPDEVEAIIAALERAERLEAVLTEVRILEPYIMPARIRRKIREALAAAPIEAAES